MGLRAKIFLGITFCVLITVLVQVFLHGFHVGAVTPETEHHWLLLNGVPPIIMSLFVLSWLRTDPRPLLNLLPTFIPGLHPPTYNNKLHGVAFRFDGKQHKIFGNDLEIFLNIQDIIYLSVIPTLFINTYFWDGGFVHKYAGSEYPMVHCQNGAHCYYKTEDYHVFDLAVYHDMKCSETREKTLSDASSFYFTAPPGAKFYKCYEWVFTFKEIIGVVGEVIAIFAFVFVVIMFFVVTVVPTNADSEENINHQIRMCWGKMALMFVGLVLSIVVNEFLYGVVFHSIESYVFWPCCFVFAIQLLNSRRQALNECLRELQEESEYEDSDAEADDLDSLHSSRDSSARGNADPKDYHPMNPIV
eukprot:gnl/MRDRNA2_/MRDRNA2_81358_c0_seq1.p1 gnl/MRDRNA2_/MRDRNA2_81358_c0~~gnl/MRDRNA2_/MRDRNA2_81358_c0_seq1.p1  ORF type:complete len:359 (+),score=41.91 gnl/MRDRNA2_/MRDRNA2_81358_c0_seq1:78-1154(+)